MPGFDRIGPNGQGSMTGGQRGCCGSVNNSRFGRGCGFGRGAGRRAGRGAGWGNNGSVMPNGQSEDLGFWENEKANLQRSLEAVEARIRQYKKPE